MDESNSRFSPIQVPVTAPQPDNVFVSNREAIVLAVIRLVIGVILPLFTRQLLNYYPFPVTTTTLQVIGATLILLAFNIAFYYQHKEDLIPKSWVLGPNFWFKSVVLLPVSVLFAGMIVLTNVGISLVPVNVHVVLRASGILWVVALAWLVQGERPSILVGVSVIMLSAGVVLISIDVTKTITSPVVPLIVNLSASVIDAVMVVAIKWSITKLQNRDPTIAPLEITFIKMAQTTVILVPLTFILEHAHGLSCLSSSCSSADALVLVAGGVVITMVYQGVVVGLLGCALATTVGILTQAQILPQVLLSIVWFHTFVPSLLHIGGTILVILGALLYTYTRWIAYKKTQIYYEIPDGKIPLLAGVNIGPHPTSTQTSNDAYAVN